MGQSDMLSIGAMGAGQGAYYTGLSREDYYVAGGEPPGLWYGKGAADLGLTGHVKAESLNRLFEGYHPHEDRTLIQNAGAKNHQPGWDLTFSAPKSVSVLWSQVSPKTRSHIERLHYDSVRYALSYIQDTAAFTRRGRGGDTKEEAHLVVATFEHGTSRAQDPQLHTHCLVMNVCTRADGTSGTIESKPLYQAKMAAGALYRAEFSMQLAQFLFVPTEQKGSGFEITGVPESLLREFSKRRVEIEEKLERMGYGNFGDRSDPEASAAAALSTRQVKGDVSREDLFQLWQFVGEQMRWGPEEAEDFLWDAYRTPENQAYLRNDPEHGKAVLEKALGRLTEQQSFFTERDLVRYTAEEAQGKCIDGTYARTLAHDYLQEKAYYLGEYLGNDVYTTPEMRDLEAKLLREVEESKTQNSPGISPTVLKGVIASRETLSDEQKDALQHICEAGDGRIRVVSGMAGTGKTNLLTAARFAWELEGFDVHGAALSGKAAKGLADGSRIKSETLHQTLRNIETGRLPLHEKSVIVVDESGMVGTRQMERLISDTEKSGARLVLVGDAKQLQPIEAGGAFLEIEKRLGGATLTQIHRQREEWARDAVHDFAAGRADEGLAAYAERGLLTISANRKEAYAALIDAWKVEGVRSPGEQLIFAGTRLDTAILNRMAQLERREAGLLGTESIAAPEGRGELYVKDRAIFTKKSRLYGVENGSMGTVVSVNGEANSIAIRMDKGERVSIPLGEFPHIRLGYAMTTHKGQGVTVEKAFVLAGGSMQDREITYVQASRSRGTTQIFADEETGGSAISRLAWQMSESRQKLMAHSVQEAQTIPTPQSLQKSQYPSF